MRSTRTDRPSFSGKRLALDGERWGANGQVIADQCTVTPGRDHGRRNSASTTVRRGNRAHLSWYFLIPGPESKARRRP